MSMAYGPRGGRLSSFRKDSSVTEHHLQQGTIRRVIGFSKPYRGQLAIFMVLIAIDAATGALTPLIYKQIIDIGIARKELSVVIGLAALVAGLAILSGVLAIGERWLSARVGEGLIVDLRTAVFDHVQRLPLAFFARTRTGALVERLNGDVLGAQQAFTSTLSNTFSNLLSVIFVIAAMLSMSWQLTLVALALLPFFILPARKVGRVLAETTREAYNLNADMGQTMNERFNVAGAHLVKVFGHPKRELAGYTEKASKVRDVGVRLAMYGTYFRVGLTVMAGIAIAVVYGLGGGMAISGALTVGTVVALASYLSRLYMPLTALSNVQVDVMTALVSFERVFEVLDLKPMVAEAPDATDLNEAVEHTGPSVEFDHVSFHYPQASEVSLASLEAISLPGMEINGEVLHEVSFTVPAGAMVALVGHSGAGKTTASQLVSRMYDPTGGTVRIAGVDLRQASLQSIRDTVGVVSQEAHVFHESIADNLRYAKPDASADDIEQALRRAQIWSLVASLPDGIDTVVGDRGYRLSGGERQRIAIARLLLKAPEVVVLDEATAHLDSESEAAVQQALHEALAGRTSLVIAHRLSTIRRADHIVVLDAGEVVEQGTHEQLLARHGAYAELYRTQFSYAESA